MIISVWHWLAIIIVGGLTGAVTGFLTTRRVIGGVWFFVFAGILGSYLLDFVCVQMFKLYIRLPVLYNLSLFFWMVLGAVLITQILNLLGEKPS